MKSILIAILVSITLTACDEGTRNYICDGEVNNGKDKFDGEFKNLYEKSVKYSYSCSGTNTITALVGIFFEKNGCSVEIDNTKITRAYYSEMKTVESINPVSSFNPRTMKLKFWLEAYDGKQLQFVGVCK